MKTDDLLDALGEADPTYIQEAEDVRYLGARKKHFMQMAACVALLLIGGSYGIWQQYESTARTDMAKTESAETAEAAIAAFRKLRREIMFMVFIVVNSFPGAGGIKKTRSLCGTGLSKIKTTLSLCVIHKDRIGKIRFCGATLLALL